MAANGDTGFANAATYQSIIIALVAASILTAIIMSVAWRRRRRRLFLQQVARAQANGRGGESESRWVELPDGTMVHVRGAKKKRKDVGSVPRLWDFELDQERERKGDGTEDEKEVDVTGGQIGDDWNPVAASVTQFRSQPSSSTPRSSLSSASDLESPARPSHSLNFSILIAMPSPSPPQRQTRSHAQPLSSPTPTSSTSQLPGIETRLPSPQYDHPVHYHLDPESEELPVVEIGSTDVLMSIPSEEKQSFDDMLETLRKGENEDEDRPRERLPRGMGLGIRIERVDGFRSGPR